MPYHFKFNIGLAAMAIACAAAAAIAQDFALQVGPPVAGNAPFSKRALLVVRPAGCADPARARITATAEGIVNGTRRSVPLTLSPGPSSGVHAVQPQWPNSGAWVVNLVGTCAGKTAGALVSVAGPSPKYNREAVKYLPHPATPAEIDASLKALTGSEK